MNRITLPTRAALLSAGACLAGLVAASSPALALDVIGTVSFEGNVVFASPIAGIADTDLVVTNGASIEAVGNGEQCAILSNGSAAVAAGGAYPDGAPLSVEIEISRGGNNLPEEGCVLQLRANGDDGGLVSASGTVTVEVSYADVDGSATVVADDIVVRQSKTIAGLDKDCFKWVKKETKLRGKCNAQLLKHGGAVGSLKCKNAGVEPPDCDPADYLDAVLALSFGQNDQQTNAPAALAVDKGEVGDQIKCQRALGKAAANYFLRRTQRAQKFCIDEVLDSEACRLQAGKDSRKKLDGVDKCVTAQATDSGSGLTLGDVGEPCRADCISAGTIDRKCLKTCFELELNVISDGVLGDTPICGNGILQPGEVCDDDNLDNGDCCSSTCTAEAPGSQSCGVGACEVTADQCSAGEAVICTPGSPGSESSVAECSDGIDNDCDGFVDGADLGCP